jgi:small subunit ribosomal protein S20
MPNKKSAEKRVRQSIKRRAINRNNRNSLRTSIKKLRAAIEQNDKNLSLELLTPTIASIDKSVNKGVLHKNTAARYKSRLTKHVNALSN